MALITKIVALDIIILFRQLTTLIEAGIPIMQAFDMLAISQEKKSVNHLILQIKHELANGNPLSHCLAKHPHYFNHFTCQLIKIGEETGKLDHLLEIVTTQKEKNYAFLLKIKQLLFYPILILIFSCLVTCCMFVFVIPKFAELFQDTHTRLPWITMLLFRVAHIIEYALPCCVLFCIFCLFFFFYYRKKYHFDGKLLSLVAQFSYIHSFQQKILLAQFARNIAITFASGLPLLEGLKLTTINQPPSEFTHMVSLLHYRISSGQSFHSAMKALTYFPSMLSNMLKIGEETGKMDQMLHRAADMIEADVNNLLQRASQLLEPLILLILGVLIGSLVIALYMPIFKLGNTI